MRRDTPRDAALPATADDTAATAPSRSKASPSTAVRMATPSPRPRTSGTSQDAESTVRSAGKFSPSSVCTPTSAPS